jgi:hypothetical protein
MTTAIIHVRLIFGSFGENLLLVCVKSLGITWSHFTLLVIYGLQDPIAGAGTHLSQQLFVVFEIFLG